MSNKDVHHIIYEFVAEDLNLHLKVDLDVVVKKLPDSNFCAGYVVFKDVSFADDGESLDEEEMSHFLNDFGDHITDRCLTHILNSKEKDSGKNSDTTIH